MAIWVLTRAINEYGQEGEYFVDAWDAKPTEEQLKKATGLDKWDRVREDSKGRREYYNDFYIEFFILFEHKS